MGGTAHKQAQIDLETQFRVSVTMTSWMCTFWLSAWQPIPVPALSSTVIRLTDTDGESGRKLQNAMFVQEKTSKFAQGCWQSLLAAKFGLEPQLCTGWCWTMVHYTPLFDGLNLPCDSFLSLFFPPLCRLSFISVPSCAMLWAWARNFPATVKCPANDWLHEWPWEALPSSSRRFIEEAEGVEVQFQARQFPKINNWIKTIPFLLLAAYSLPLVFKYTPAKSWIFMVCHCLILLGDFRELSSTGREVREREALNPSHYFGRILQFKTS